ncbi:hypothetical protein F959_00400 [Acinetobacter venetianus RAG-1 = CIP 110063]|uniref:Uncharacterized protein n=1 Tax=Acinetobacter venetianus (strain ATCC 31012 / DSM 23050 / BCRC 14357 / CCUG 45561 / CIP 110063 / KCTC 2702 / LMG 19082 / RAG-1) TaxID=1191460 RepID=N8YPD6_ACIVR|nr:hypothetical protein F959_00400 [Acinetobacter venetianus RAG-1 = CIP 110063]
MMKTTVRHRLDDLEMMQNIINVVTLVRHRLDDLEIYHFLL